MRPGNLWKQTFTIAPGFRYMYKPVPGEQPGIPLTYFQIWHHTQWEST